MYTIRILGAPGCQTAVYPHKYCNHSKLRPLNAYNFASSLFGRFRISQSTNYAAIGMSAAEVKDESREADKSTVPPNDNGNTTKGEEAAGGDDKATGAADTKDGQAASSSKPSYIDYIQSLIAEKLHLHSDDDADAGAGDKNILGTVDFDGVMKKWKSGGFKNIITMVGAGISTSSGIPDFRSPDVGLYNNLQKYNLPHPSAIFELDYFRDNPQPFFTLAKELYPGSFKPTPCHYFIRLLHEKGLLNRHYTQNIDALERVAGIPAEAMVEAHGTFYTNHCIDCRKEYSKEWAKEEIFAERVPTCTKCNGLVKPDIVFFGEDLPARFYTLPQTDFRTCDLLIIMGTSLEVQPFASLIEKPNRKCVRLLINREKVGTRGWFSPSDGLRFNKKDNKRDVVLLGDCDDGVTRIASELGFEDELKALIDAEHTKIDELKICDNLKGK